LRVDARGTWGYGLPDYATEVAEAVEGWAVAEEGAVLGAGGAVGVGRRHCAGSAWRQRS